MSTPVHTVRVGPLPVWLDHARLLGPGFVLDPATRHAEATLPRPEAADLMARLRGLHLDGEAVTVFVRPRLARREVREGRTRLARALRETSPGFTRGGVMLDEEGRFSLTPERLALTIGTRMASLRVVDATCGCGGNAIGFARAGCEVVAIEQDPDRLAMARHNARIYQVSRRITFLQGDATELVPQHHADLLFVDPPWGGDWDKTGVALADLPLLEELLEHRQRFDHTWAKVPPSFLTATTPDARPQAWFGHAAGDRRRIKFLLMRWSSVLRQPAIPEPHRPKTHAGEATANP